MSKKKEKLRAQVKSRFYYLFWGAATLSVFGGQMYVGTGYRRMSRTLEKVIEAPIVLDFLPEHKMMDPIWDPEYDYWDPKHDHPMIIR